MNERKDRNPLLQTLSSDESDTMPIHIRLLLWLMFAGYAAYAYNVGEVRASLGVSQKVGQNNAVDQMQQMIAMVLLLFITVFVLVGKKRETE